MCVCICVSPPSENGVYIVNEHQMVTIVNPGNPTGLTLPPHELHRISNLCKAYNCWLVVDNTYEAFAGGW